MKVTYKNGDVYRYEKTGNEYYTTFPFGLSGYESIQIVENRLKRDFNQISKIEEA